MLHGRSARGAAPRNMHFGRKINSCFGFALPAALCSREDATPDVTSGSRIQPATGKETSVSKLRVNAFTVSADGFGAGPDQGQDQPLGRGGQQLHQWFVPTRTFQRNVLKRDGGTTGTDNDFAARSFENLGAWIMGRNMFG